MSRVGQDLRVIGVDPGLVHTGLVHIQLDGGHRCWSIDHALVRGLDHKAIAQWCEEHDHDAVFIEAYKPRSHFNTDSRLTEGIHKMRAVIPKSSSLDNSGSQTVITNRLMQDLGLWKFSTPSHHQDLRSAARIALFGVVKNAQWNPLLAQFVLDGLDGQPWSQV